MTLQTHLSADIMDMVARTSTNRALYNAPSINLHSIYTVSLTRSLAQLAVVSRLSLTKEAVLPVAHCLCNIEAVPIIWIHYLNAVAFTTLRSCGGIYDA